MMDMNGSSSNCLILTLSFPMMQWDASRNHPAAMPVVGHLGRAVEQLSHPMPAVPGQQW